MVLTVLGIQRDVLGWLDSVQFRVANAHLTLLSVISGALWVCVTLMVAMWLGSVLEDRLTRASTLDANLKVVLSRVGRALLVFAAVLIGLSLVGIDVTVLGVFGGAVGVGLGFGCRRSPATTCRASSSCSTARCGSATRSASAACRRRHADPHALHGRARPRRQRDADPERKADHRRRAEPVVVPDARLREGRRAGRVRATSSTRLRCSPMRPRAYRACWRSLLRPRIWWVSERTGSTCSVSGSRIRRKARPACVRA